MLKHGRAGVPMEVMGLMLGEFVDDYTVRVIDVFAMPQSGTVSFATLITHLIVIRLFTKCHHQGLKLCSLLWYIKCIISALHELSNTFWIKFETDYMVHVILGSQCWSSWSCIPG